MCKYLYLFVRLMICLLDFIFLFAVICQWYSYFQMYINEANLSRMQLFHFCKHLYVFEHKITCAEDVLVLISHSLSLSSSRQLAKTIFLKSPVWFKHLRAWGMCALASHGRFNLFRAILNSNILKAPG